MEYLITDLVKYMNIILVALYTYLAYRVFVIKDKDKQKRIYKQMSVLMYLFHGFSYLVIIIRTENYGIVLFYGIQIVSLALISTIYKKCYKNMSLLIFQNMRMMLCFGYIMLARFSVEVMLKHFLFSMATLLVCLIVPAMIKRFGLWQKLGYVYLLFGIGILLIVYFFGSEVYGAVNWISIGRVMFQPSEFVKLLFVVGCAALLSKKQDFKHICIVTFLAAIHVLILVLEKDLGAAMIFFVTYIIILYCATQKSAYLAAGICAGAIGAIVSYYLFSHVKVRVVAFLDPFAVIENQGYQLSQSLFAIGTGGFFGLGLFNGDPESIPVVKSDFIFSAIAEEMGGIVAICLALICLSCFILFVNLSVKIKNTFFKLVALGFSTLYIFQVFVNIAGVIKLIPSTGVTFPFVSSGGSSVMSSILMFSMLQGIFILYLEPQKGKAATAKRQGGKKEAKKLEEYNKSIVWITYVFATCIFVAIGYLAYFNLFKAKTVINNVFNPRTDVLAKQITRGEIYSSDRKILAQSVVLEDGNEVRVYPFDKTFSHTVGRMEKGKTGIELQENFNMMTSSISGIEKMSYQMQDEKLPGDSVVVTLDSRLQKAAFNALEDKKGAVVVLEVSTGKVLAMVSTPAYNPNTIQNDWDKLLANENESALLNRASHGLYPPGSTFKVITLLEYIRENPDYDKFEYTCTGSERQNNVTIHCAGNKAHGTIDLEKALAVSCNSAFSYIGSSLDMDALNSLCSTFLFGGQVSGRVPSSQGQFVLNGDSDASEIPQTVIGLGKTLMTPLHNASIAAAIANHGVLMEPYSISHIENEHGKIIKEYSPKVFDTLMTEDEAEILSKYMRAVVSEGTGASLSGIKKEVAGKTGTAEYETGKSPHAWFIGFTEDIAISVLVESSGSGSSVAVPIAKKIFEEYYK